MVKAYGFRTDQRTRPVIISGLKDAFNDHPENFLDDATLREMLTFIKNDAGRPEAAEGEHDDLVMGLAIANEIRKQQNCKLREEPEEKPEKLITQLRKNKRRHR